MADHRRIGNLAQVLRLGRDRVGLTQLELAERTNRERSWIAALESGQRHAQLAAAVDLGRALDIPDTDITDAWYRDAVRRHVPDVAPQLERRVDGTVSAWDRIARDRMRVEEGVVTLQIDSEGTLDIDLDYRRCTTPRPRRRLIIRNQILGEEPERIDVIQAPEYEVASRTHRKVWREHELFFAETWQPADPPIHIGLRVRARGAYLLGTGPDWEQRKAMGAPAPPIGVYAYDIRHSFERLRMPMSISDRVQVQWLDPVATIDDAMLTDDPSDIRPVSEVTSAVKWTTDGNRAELMVIRPLPTYRLYLRWESIHGE